MNRRRRKAPARPSRVLNNTLNRLCAFVTANGRKDTAAKLRKLIPKLKAHPARRADNPRINRISELLPWQIKL